MATRLLPNDFRIMFRIKYVIAIAFARILLYPDHNPGAAQEVSDMASRLQLHDLRVRLDALLPNDFDFASSGHTFGSVGVCFSGLGAGGGSTRLHGLVAISVLMLRSWVQASS